jgi:hypothetical protein
MIYKTPTYQKFWWVPAKYFGGYLLKVLVPVHINYIVLTICNIYIVIGTYRWFGHDSAPTSSLFRSERW